MSTDSSFYVTPEEHHELLCRCADLEELCNLMYVYHNGGCTECSFKDECERSRNFECVAPRRINDKAHELGIGVEE